MLIRVRHPGGTTRIKVDDAATLAQLCQGISQTLGIGDDLEITMLRLSHDPSGRLLLSTTAAATLSSLGLEHGSMIHLQPKRKEDMEDEKDVELPPEATISKPHVEAPATTSSACDTSKFLEDDPEMAEAIAIVRNTKSIHLRSCQ